MIKEIIKRTIPEFLLSFYHYSLSLMGALWYRFPSREIVVIGITGTSGKSTVVNLTNGIFKEAGFKTASMSSVKFTIRDKEYENKLKMTMPGRMKVQRFLRQAVKADCKYVILEVSSEGIRQHRHKFINFEVVVFTNLSPEHIEAHGGFDNYERAKLSLFKENRNIHIINKDDKNAKDFLDILAKQKIEFGIDDKNLLPNHLNLLGEFNVYNAITAIRIATSQGISLDVCRESLEKAKGIPGRMEIIINQPFTVIVDYAHTPDQLEKVYQSLGGKRKICVLGSCGGGRDKWKRPVLGKIADQYCDKIIITNEDPYDEDPMEIINQVAGDIPVEKILDRRLAIRKAIGLAEPNDVVIITGKGSEPWMCVRRSKKIPWSDREIVKENLPNKQIAH